MGSPSTVKALSRVAFVAVALILALITWLPKLLLPAKSQTNDILFEQTAQAILCEAGPDTGWPINDDSVGVMLGAFAPTLPSYLVARASCMMASLLPINGFQAFLIAGISLTVLITYAASRVAGIGVRPSLLISYGLATAPCSFSRVGHLQLSQLWPIMPCIAICALLLGRDQYPISRQGRLIKKSSLGLAMGALSFTAQEYYAAFSAFFVATCYIIGITIAAKKANEVEWHGEEYSYKKNPHEPRFHYAYIAVGYILAMTLSLASKQVLWGVPRWAYEATRRVPVEQFMYGFWPSNLLTSPLINTKLYSIFAVTFNLPVTETPFMSSSGIVVITALGVLLFCWTKANNKQQGAGTSMNSALIIAFGGVLIATILIACIVATSGGLGTLFAVFVSPQLRSLNRITPYFYCPALTVCAIGIDQFILEITRPQKIRVKI